MATTKKIIQPLKSYKTQFLIAAGFVIVMIIVLLFVIFSRKPDTGKYDELKKAYETILKIRAEERATDSINLITIKEQTETYRQGFEYYKQLANKNIQFYKDNEKKFRDIPNTVPVVTNKDSLRAAAKRFD